MVASGDAEGCEDSRSFTTANGNEIVEQSLIICTCKQMDPSECKVVSAHQ